MTVREAGAGTPGTPTTPGELDVLFDDPTGADDDGGPGTSAVETNDAADANDDDIVIEEVEGEAVVTRLMSSGRMRRSLTERAIIKNLEVCVAEICAGQRHAR